MLAPDDQGRVWRKHGTDIPCDTGDFRLITRRVLDLLIAMPKRHRFVRDMVAWIDGEQVPLVYDRDARVAGESKDPFTEMLRFAVDAITSFSIVPLKVSVILGWVMAAIGFAAAIDSAVSALVGHTVPAWASPMALVGLLAGRQFLMLGIIASYLGRLYDQSEGRRLLMTRDIVGGATEMAAATRTGVAILAPTAHPPDYPDCR
jgi:hypothetical protein